MSVFYEFDSCEVFSSELTSGCNDQIKVLACKVEPSSSPVQRFFFSESIKTFKEGSPELDVVVRIGLPDLGNKYTGLSAKFEFQINNK